jgi:hypothetical protein
MSYYTWSFGLEIGFTDHLYTQPGTTSSYRATAILHTSQIITAPAKSFAAFYVLNTRSLVTASNSEDSSASTLKSTLHSLPYRTDLVTPVVFL